MRVVHLIALAVATAGIAWCCTGELVRSEDVSRPTRQVTHSAAPSRSAEMLFFGWSAALTVSTLVSRGSRRIGVGTQEASPLPPNRTSGFPAFVPPVGGLLSKVNKTKSPKHLLKHT